MLASLKNLRSAVSRGRHVISTQNVLPPSTFIIRNNSTESGQLLTPGSTYDGFHCKKSQFYPEFNMTAYLLQHQKLQTEYLHVHRNDNNNVFSVNFRTPAMDSTGLPHILEHLALCGSQKFPVRDPFFKMLNRSLATFMNAMTGPDYTLYPFSSTNEVDFRNLQSIYLDAVFRPNLKYLDFLQEGWRLENSDLTNKDSEIGIKGVVFNEMKGAFASNNMVLNYGLINNLLPDHTYGHVSGGEPLDIPQLSYEDLVEFHKKHYHPSNARIFSYGNFDVRKSLKYINDEYFSQFSPSDREFSKVPTQKRWSKPRQTKITCRYDTIGAHIEKQCQFAVGYVMADITDSYESLVLNVLGELLVRGPNSSFYKTLIEPNVIGGSFSQVTGFDSQLKDTIFVVALQNINSKDFDLVQKLFDETIDEVIEKGFDEGQVESILHTIELNIKHQTPKFGLSLLFNITAPWNHDVNTLEYLNTGDHLNRLQDNLKNKTYLQERVKHYFKDNRHKLVLSMVPDEKFEEKTTKAERELLAKKVSALTNEDRSKIFETAQQLAAEQKEKVSNTHLLPCLSLSDISPEIERTNVETFVQNGVPTQVTLTDTNEVVYVQGICLADHLTLEEKLLLPLLAEVFAQMGTKNHNFRDFDKLLMSKTSGISFNLHFSENITNLNQYELGVAFGSFCLEKNVDDMFQLLNELLVNFELVDVQRFAVLLEDYMSSLTADIAQTGHMYAVQSCTGLLTEGNQLKSQLSGIEHIDYMKKLCKELPPDQLLKKLQEVGKRLFENGSLRYALNVTEKSKTKVLDSFSKLTNASNKRSVTTSKWIDSKPIAGNTESIVCLHNVVNFPVNYCSKSILTVPYVHEDYARLRILAKTLSAKYLLPVVREQNGAYGAGANINQNGVFSFFSYRDPYTRKTLDTFDETPLWLKNNWANIDNQALFEAKLGVLQVLDAPIAPGYKGLSQFKNGVTDEIFAEQRKRILNVSRDDLVLVADKYFGESGPNDRPVGKCVLGPHSDDVKKMGEIWCVNNF